MHLLREKQLLWHFGLGNLSLTHAQALIHSVLASCAYGCLGGWHRPCSKAVVCQDCSGEVPSRDVCTGKAAEHGKYHFCQGGDVLCVSHGIVRCGNAFMLGKALMGQGEKKKRSLCYVVAASSHKLHRGRKLSERINCVFRLLRAAVLICRAAKDLQCSYFQLDGGVVILEICPRDLNSSPWLVTVLSD